MWEAGGCRIGNSLPELSRARWVSRPARQSAMAQPPFLSSSCSARRPPLPASPTSLHLPSSWSTPRHSARRRAVAPAPASVLNLSPGEIAELAQNKVLIAATAAAAIGQLYKQFASAKDGAGIDLFSSGGMPSTHSAAVVAVATSLGLERGFADSVFGMSVVFAAIVMYDAQGVRWEVGKHAKVLNKYLALKEKMGPNWDIDMTAELVSVPEEVIPSSPSKASPSRHSPGAEWRKVNALRSSEPDERELEQVKLACLEKGNMFKENVGHTQAQVTAGALLGFVVSLVTSATL